MEQTKSEKEGCYFWINQAIPEEKRGISVMCEVCHEKHPTLGWYWPGAKGFGPYDIVCDECSKIIHKGIHEK